MPIFGTAVIATVVILVLFWAAIGAAEAHADPLPDSVSAAIDSVHAAGERGGIPNGRAPVTCDEICEDLWRSEHAPMPNQPASKTLHRELWRLRWKSKLLPALRVLGRASLVGTAAEVTYTIGNALNKRYVKAHLPAGSGTVNGVSFYAEGDNILGYSTGSSMIWLNAPVDGFGGMTNDQLAYVDGGTAGCWFYGTIAADPFPGFGTINMTVDGYCNGQITYVVAFDPVLVTTDSYSGQTPTNGHVPWPTTADPGTNGEPTSTTRDRLRGELENNPGDYPTLRDWLCAHLGGDCEDPTGQLMKLPTCLGMTFQACESALRDKGLQGTVTKRTLSPDDAIMEEDAGRTTAIYPGGGVRYDTDVTVYVNPTTMPTMTALETTVSQQLEQKNPEVVDEQADKPFAFKTIAKRCVKAASVLGSGVNPTDCGSLPIFVTGYDAVVPAENDATAIVGHPSWLMLHRRTSRSNTGWYRSKDGCRDGDYDAFEDEFGFGPQCHEYPFWSTHQAYNGLLNDAQPRIQLSPPGQNSTVQGGALQQFYGTPRGFPFPPCNIPVTPDDTLALIPPALRMTLGTQTATQTGSGFLNVPIGEEGGRIRTVGLCNDRPAP